MPLAFESKSHGTIAFGFFNIETDILLLHELFFFATDFCRAVIELGEQPATSVDGWRIRDHQRIGNLHGAIGGVDHTGFIGALYARFPFPSRPEDFKQNPEGDATQDWVCEQIARFGEAMTIPFEHDAEGTTRIGQYTFTAEQFDQLVAYVDRGGYPRWKDDVRPPYVEAMMRQTRQ